MAWEACYSAEGWANIRAQVELKAKLAAEGDEAEVEWLIHCWTEVRCTDQNQYGSSRLRTDWYPLVERKARKLLAMGLSDALADDIVDFCEEDRTCSNGGHEMYCCPWGCHTVPPEPVPGDDDE